MDDPAQDVSVPAQPLTDPSVARSKRYAETKCFRETHCTVNVRREVWAELKRVAKLNGRSCADELSLAIRFWCAGDGGYNA